MHTLEEGQRFERYRILHYLGEGISGESYEVEDIALQRKATLKLIHPWSTLTDAARRQFFRQMQVISLLTHTYLTTMLDYGEVDGQLYIVRQYTGYGSLLGPAGRAWFNPPLGEAEAIRYTYQLAQALHKIHKYRYVHGALSLSNILVVSAPPAEKARATASPFLLTDVGLGHFVRRYGHPRITHLPATAAPEQMELRLLPASDQYALAALLYFWLTGRHLFQGTSEEITQAKLSGSFIAPTELNSSITPAQEAILRRALSIAPEERYPSILTFTEELAMTLTSRPPTQAKPVAVPQPLPTTPEATPTTATSPLPNLPITEELPTTIESPAVEEATAVVEEAMTIAENPAVEVAPTNAEDPTVEEVPTIAESLIAEGATAVTDGLAVEETPTTAVSPAAEEAATVAESLGVEETPTTVESSATEEALAATSSPSGIEAGAATQPSKRTFSDFIPLSLPELSVLEQAETTNRQPQNQQENTPKSSSQAEAEAIFALEESQELPPFVASLTSTEPPKELIYLDRQAGTPETPSQPTKNQTHPAQAYMYIQAPGTKEPHRVLLDQDEVTIGRAGASDILLDQDTLTSRHHARLKRIDDKYVIVDQRSLHGTLLNGEQLTSEKEYPLNEGDRIAIGDYVLIFHDRT